MKLELDDTIAALASAPGGAARSIVRVSGPAVREVLARSLQVDDDALSAVRRPQRVPARFVVPGCAASLPVDVYLWPTRRSYTGQPMAELHTWGSPPLVEALLERLFRSGARPAEPGEFTLRAFLSGRIDLVQAEAVLGVVNARTQEELRTALQQLAGSVSGRVASLRQELLELLADLEAGLDFADEDIQFIDRPTLVARIQRCSETLRQLLEEASSRIRSTVCWRVVLAGLPNAGKSTLFNALLGRPAALVSPTEGTTRDYLVEPLELEGVDVELVDTAGRESSRDRLVQTAQQLRRQQLQQADLVLWCSALDADQPTRRQDEAEWRRLAESDALAVRVWTKSDRLAPTAPRPEGLVVSAVCGEGLDRLRRVLAERLTGTEAGERRMLGTTAARCRDSLAGAVEALQRALEAAQSDWGDEVIAVELREALDELGKVLGEVYTDDILDRIFSKFCIGK